MMYEPLENFLVRVPLLPINFFISTTNGKFIKESIDHLRVIYKATKDQPEIYHLIFNSLLIANNRFIKNLITNNQKMESYYTMTILQYLIRMSTRTTPFGIFASVGVCNFSDTFKLSFKDTTIFRARADMGWISKFVYGLEVNQNFPNDIHLMLNPLHLKFTERVFILDSLPFLYTDKNIQKSIRNTGPINTILKLFKNSRITYSNLLTKLTDTYKNKKAAEGLIHQLIKESFIITEMRPPLTNIDPLEYISQKLKKGNIRTEISHLKNKIDTLNKSQHHNFLANYKDITKSVDNINGKPIQNYIRVETALINPKIQLPKSISYDVAELAELMLSITTFPKGYDRIKEFRERFIEKYGYEKIVNIVELLDEDLGLGSPYKSKNSQSKNSNIHTNPTTNRILFKLISNSLKEHSIIAEVFDSDINKIRTWIPDDKDAPLSMNININICVKDPKRPNLKDYKIVMSSAGGNREALSSLSRVADVIGKPAYKLIEDITKKEYEVSKECILAEVFAYPIYKEISDLEIHRPFYKYAIYLDQISNDKTTKQIYLSDIYIGIQSDKFYIYSRKLKSLLKIQNTTLMNEEMAPEVMRFLIDISNNDQQPILNHFNWGTAKYMPFLPRIEYKKFILSLARWNISKDSTPELFIPNKNLFTNSLNKWRKVWMVPKFVYLSGEYESRFVIDLESKNHIEILYSKIKKLKPNDSLLIIEAFPYQNGIRLIENNNNYLAEFIIPLIKKHTSNKGINKNITPTTERIPNSFFRPREWLFIKLYMKEDLEDEFIIQKISGIIHLITKKNNIPEWFFMRYADPNNHIRLRFKVKQESDLLHLLPLIYKWSINQVNQQQILKFTIDTYEREVERYGGKQGMELSEKFFSQDSKIAINLLYNMKLSNFKDKIPICALSIDYMLKRMGIKIEDRISFYRKLTSNINYITSKNFAKRLDIMLLTSLQTEQKTKVQNIMNKSFDSSLNRNILNVWEELKDLEIGNKLTTDQNNILGSYIHMHCIRIFGLKRESEFETYILLRRYTEITHLGRGANK